MAPTPKKPTTRKSRIRKQVHKLTAADFTRHPVWEYALDEEGRRGQDEATVRPYKRRGALDPRRGMFAVRAWLTLADGTRLRGYLQPPVPEDSGRLWAIQPTAVVAGGQVWFWSGMLGLKRSEIKERYARLGKSSSRQVFPLRFQSDFPIVGGPVTGEVPGFVVLENVRTWRTRVVK